MFETQSLDAVGRISQGDCVDALAKLPAGVADLVFADPPFNIGYDYDIYNDKKARSEYLEWSRKWIGSVHRALKPDGTFWLAIGDEYAAELKILSQDVGFYCRSWVIWYYTFGVNCTRKFSRSHAHLFHFVKNPKNFTFRENELENRIPSARQLVYGDARANPHGRLPDDTWILRPQDIVDCFTPSEDSWYFPRVAGTFSERAGFHGCQMPEQLLGRIIRTCSNEDDLVLDPFSGSATTLVVAKKLGRRFMGFELSEDYTRRGTERLELCRTGDPLEGAKEPLLSAPNTSSRSEPKRAKKVSVTPVQTPTKRDSHSKSGDALVEVFRRIHDGYSLDRVIADPALDARLETECRALGLEGDIVSWNQALFGLRKKGRLSGIPTSRRTELSWIDCDSYLFAVEIALRQMKDQGIHSLDEILCNPVLASEFDHKARSLAPGYESLHYRWGALKIRKAANFALKRALDYKQVSEAARMTFDLLAPDFDRVPASPGVYLVSGQKGQRRNLYGGGALNLQQRFSVQFGAETTEIWKSKWKAAQILVLPHEDPDPMNLLGLQSRWIQKYKPKLNYLGQPAA